MTPGELIAAFETLAEAPGGVKRLRELVLQLAVRGKLVPQEPVDAIGSVRIEKDFSWMRRGSRLRTALDVEPPFDLPPYWRWYRLGEVTHDWGTKEPSQPFTYIDMGAALFGRRQEKVMERLAGQVCGVRVRDRRLAGWCR